MNEHDLRGLTLAEKQRRLVAALRGIGDCAWPVDDAIEIIPLGGGRLALSIEQALQRLADYKPLVVMDVQRPQGGTLIDYDSEGRRCAVIADPVSNFAFPPQPSGRRRI